MFILSLTYAKPIEEADRWMTPHVAWLDEGYESGLLLASGRKIPRTGGVILARGRRAEIEAFVARDPFLIEGVATYEIIEWVASRTAPGLEGFTA